MNFGPQKGIARILTQPKCSYTVSWRKSMRHVVLAYSFWSQKFLERNFDYLNWLSTRTCGAGRPDVGLCHALLVVVRPPGTTVPDGLMFYRRCIFFFFVSPLVLRAPSTDPPETLPHGRNLAEFYNPTPKIRGALPQKNLGGKNMQNFGQFCTTSDFDREYLRNGWRYPKSVGVTNYGNSFCVQRKKSRELWSTNGLEWHVSLDPLKMHFLWHTISRPLGGAAPRNLYMR